MTTILLFFAGLIVTCLVIVGILFLSSLCWAARNGDEMLAHRDATEPLPEVKSQP